MAIGTGAAILGGSLVSGIMGKNSADKQGRISQQQYNQTRNDLAPYRDAGTNALNTYTGRLETGGPGIYDEFQGSPMYDEFQNNVGDPDPYKSTGSFKFNPQEDEGYLAALASGLQAVDRKMNSGGFGNSGNILAALNQKGMEFGYNNYDRTFSRQLAESNTNYGRNVTDYGIDTSRNQDLYGRQRDEYGMDVSRNQDVYGRELTGYGLDVGRNQEIYGRDETELNRYERLAGSGQNAAAGTGAAGAANVTNH